MLQTYAKGKISGHYYFFIFNIMLQSFFYLILSIFLWFVLIMRRSFIFESNLNHNPHFNILLLFIEYNTTLCKTFFYKNILIYCMHKRHQMRPNVLF
jgi:hypothetical protein